MLTTTGAQFLKDTHGIETAAVDSRSPRYNDHNREQLEEWLDAYCSRDGTERVLTGKILDFIAASNEQANSLIDDIAIVSGLHAKLNTELYDSRLALTAAGNLQVGSFTLRASPDPEFVLIRHESGEGGSFKTANLEQALFKFFGEQF